MILDRARLTYIRSHTDSDSRSYIESNDFRNERAKQVSRYLGTLGILKDKIKFGAGLNYLSDEIAYFTSTLLFLRRKRPDIVQTLRGLRFAFVRSRAWKGGLLPTIKSVSIFVVSYLFRDDFDAVINRFLNR